ncbi:hypothetical protein ACRYCC_28190 [Actinomadura scrupuli]|uniref:hypothetical protein n=1 Tax=Actinomadura scrupuli TaxID=559629 RepID=UPI003D956CBA
MRHSRRRSRWSGRSATLYQRAKVHDGIAGVLLHVKGQESARIRWREALDPFQALKVPEAQAVEIRLNSLDDLAS